MSARPVVPLEFLGPHERARVVEMDGESSAVHRLQELGLRVGTIVEMVKSGRPSILRIGEHRLSFRPADQMSVMVEVLTAGECPSA
ncbi:MAG: FeoA domain-containing protein [Planctomycetaceae bacterium]